MTATFTEWSDADSRALDAEARTHTRSPLKYDHYLGLLLAPRCTQCDRPMRQTNIPAAERPGTVAKGTKDLCGTCLKAQRDNRPPPQPYKRKPPPERCLGPCGRTMKPRDSDSTAEAIHKAHGLCRTCYAAYQKAKQDT